jgi:hypothetical protein
LFSIIGSGAGRLDPDTLARESKVSVIDWVCVSLDKRDCLLEGPLTGRPALKVTPDLRPC